MHRPAQPRWSRSSATRALRHQRDLWSCWSFHRHRCRVAGGHELRLIHGLDPRWADAEDTRVHHFQQVGVFGLPAPEIIVEESGAVIAQLAIAAPMTAPPGWLLVELVQVIACDRLGPRRNWVLDHQVFPVTASDGDAYCKRVAHLHWTRQLVEM